MAEIINPEDNGGVDEEQLRKDEEVLREPQVKEVADLLELVWRCYVIVRHELVRRTDKRLKDEVISMFSQFLAEKSATEPFSIGNVKNGVKNCLLPFLKSMSIKEMRLTKESEQNGNTTDAS